MKKLALLAAMFLGLSATAQAACTRNDLTGTWMVYSSGGNYHSSRCQLIFPKKGDVIATTCTDALNNTSSGTFTIAYFNSDCNLRAGITTSTGSIFVDAYVSKGKDSVSGMWLNNIDTPVSSGSFNGSKQ